MNSASPDHHSTQSPDAPRDHRVFGEPVKLYEATSTADRNTLWSDLRAQYGTVAPVEVLPGVRAWLVLSYRHGLAVLQNSHLFRRDTRTWRAVQDGRVDITTSPPPFNWRPNAFYADGDEHRRLRAPIVNSLSRLNIGQVTDTIQRYADELIDDFVGTGQADLLAEYAQVLPALVSNNLFGLPDSYGYMLGDLTAALFDADPRRGAEAAARIEEYFTGLVARKRQHPGNDITSWLLADPVGLDDIEATHQATLINSASHMPTTHIIGNTLYTLLTNPAIANAYRGSQLTTQELLDHVMWTMPPFQVHPARYAAQDLRIGDTEIPAGDAVLVCVAGVHSDPAVAQAPSGGPAPTAGNRAHLSFSAGPHACPAQDLARTIAAVAVQTAVNRLERLNLAVPVQDLRWVPTPHLSGLLRLPATFTPRAPARPPRSERPEPEEEPTETARPRRNDLLSRLFRGWRRERRTR